MRHPVNKIERVSVAAILAYLLSAGVACTPNEPKTERDPFFALGVPPGSEASKLECDAEIDQEKNHIMIKRCPGRHYKEDKLLYLSSTDLNFVLMEVDPIITYTGRTINIKIDIDKASCQRIYPGHEPASINLWFYSSTGNIVAQFSLGLGGVIGGGKFPGNIIPVTAASDPASIKSVKVFGFGGAWKNC